MPDLPSFSFSKIGLPSAGTVIVPVASGKAMGPVATALDESCGGAVTRAMEIAGFEGKAKATLDIIAPQGGIDRISLIGVGSAEGRSEADWRNLGGVAAAFVKPEAAVTALMELGDGDDVTSEDAAAFADGIRLKSYTFDRHKTGKGDTGDKKKKDKKPAKIAIASADAAGARKIFKSHSGVTDGVFFARDLVNEPANILGPVEFAARVEKLKSLGVEVQILGEKELTKLGMGALLGVAQGSVRPPRVAVMKWKGVKSKSKSKDFEAPLAFVGKGVVFDTGGISLKPPGGMEDMKGDMGGAAAVSGLMHALAARKAKVNALGIIGLVENMPDGNAQRPGDIVTSMSGQTIEVINTDAEGRLVLADLLWYIQGKYKPKFMIDLATLTGAIIISLGHFHAGLFSNDDTLAETLTAAGLAADEPVWRMPLGEKYDKMLESKFADMKNVGERSGGAITAAQFLQRFVNDVPWVHLDVAGTAMGSKKSDVNDSWGSGYGVRLLDRFVADNYE